MCTWGLIWYHSQPLLHKSHKQEIGQILGGTVFWLDSSLLNSSFSVSYSSSVMYVFSELIQLNKEQNIASNMKSFDNFSTIFAGISKQLRFCMNRSIRDSNQWMYLYPISCAYPEIYTFRVLQTIQMKLIHLCVWAEPPVLGSCSKIQIWNLNRLIHTQFNVWGRI